MTPPKDIRNLLDRLQKSLQQVIKVLSVHKGNKGQALDLISNALPKINLDFVLKILKELNKCESEPVRIKAEEMLEDIFGIKTKKFVWIFNDE